MALKPCRECGNQVSSSAASCPNCGAAACGLTPCRSQSPPIAKRSLRQCVAHKLQALFNGPRFLPWHPAPRCFELWRAS